MCDTTIVAPDYKRGFDRKKGLAAKVFVMMTVVFCIALIPVSLLVALVLYVVSIHLLS